MAVRKHAAWEHVPKMPDPEKESQSLERSAAAALQLRVRGDVLDASGIEHVDRLAVRQEPPAGIGIHQIQHVVAIARTVVQVAQQAAVGVE